MTNVLALSVYAAYSLCMTYTVQCDGLSKSFGQTLALDAVDLRITTGSIYGLLGPNGAGKTTLVRILSTLVRSDAGTALVAGHDLVSDADGVRRSIGLTGQYAAVDDVLTGEENLLMMARLRKLSATAARTRTTELLEEFDLVHAAGRRAGTYSGGMKRRLDLAVSMIERPALLFLDEPTTGLDPRSREQVWATVSQLKGEGVTILLTTQYLEEADRLADLVGVLDGGRIVAEGTPEELKSTVGAEQVRFEMADRAAFDEARRVFPGAVADLALLTLGLSTDGSAESLAELLAVARHHDLAIRRVDTQRPSLDDVFLSLTDRRVVAA
jgi:ABC-2 type transport system ATP-binding protein